MKGSLIVFPDLDELTDAAAQHFLSVGQAAILQKGRFSVVLSGGNTPRLLYRRMTSPRFQDAMDWNDVHFFWGDERCVPPEHAESNYRMVRETLLDHLPIPGSNIHRVMTELPPQEAARHYENELKIFFGQDLEDPPPKFDLVLLGMGSDGHTASLFPNTAAIHEKQHWVVAHYIEAISAWRVTLTPVILNAAHDVLFLIAGEEKAKVLCEVIKGADQPDILPAQVIQPKAGNLHWFVDEPAIWHIIPQQRW